MIPDPESPNRETIEILSRIEEDLARLRSQIGK